MLFVCASLMACGCDVGIHSHWRVDVDVAWGYTQTGVIPSVCHTLPALRSATWRITKKEYTAAKTLTIYESISNYCST